MPIVPAVELSRRFSRRLRTGCALVALVLVVALSARIAVRDKPRVWRVAFNQFAPYVEKGPDGHPVGFAAEVFEEAARRANVKFRWVRIDGGADQAFAEGKADLYPLMTIRSGNAERFYMSAPWWENEFALISTEKRPIFDAAGATGKTIATRLGVVQKLSKTVLPRARLVILPTLDDMEAALCAGTIDGFFSDMRLLQSQLLKRTAACAGQPLHAASVSRSKLYMGTGSTFAASAINDKIFGEIAKLALDGTLARAASKRGIVTPYDTARLKQVVDAEEREHMMAWALGAALVVLGISLFQTRAVRRAKKEAEAAHAHAREAQHRFDEFMKHTPAFTFIKDERRQVVYSNEKFAGKRMGALVGGENGIPPRLCERDDEAFDSGRGLEVTETLTDSLGRERHFLVLKFPFEDAAGGRYLGGVALDVTARVRAEKELEYHAKVDLLTGLPNRRSYMTCTGMALGDDQAGGMAVAFVDLDGFKQVNDLFGHEGGDALLIQVAERLRNACRDSDMVARMGGDEFTFLLRGVDPAEAQKRMEAALEVLEQPFAIAGEEIRISASIGVSLSPLHGSALQDLMRKADAAMYSAKRNGKGRVQIWAGPEDQSLAALYALGRRNTVNEYSLATDPVS